jgi:hypothetical protein
MARGKQFTSFADAFAPGSYEIWYSREEFFRDASMGYEWLWERNLEPKTQADLEKNWVKLGTMMPAKLEDIFYHLQGEKWSPNGEAYDFIGNSGSAHTSMSVGDIIKDGNKLHIVDRIGFQTIELV